METALLSIAPVRVSKGADTEPVSRSLGLMRAAAR
jgi:hypothetical protein